jgi:hypothetical protein
VLVRKSSSREVVNKGFKGQQNKSSGRLIIKESTSYPERWRDRPSEASAT